MAEEEKKIVSRLKIKKKVWIPVVASKLFGHAEIGEMYVTGPDVTLHRQVECNLRDLTGNIRDQNVILTFTIGKTSPQKLEAELTGYALAPTFIKRLVRKGADRLDECIPVTTKDHLSLMVKLLLVTVGNTTRTAQKRIRREVQKALVEAVEKQTFEEFIQNIVNYSLSDGLKKKLLKIHPVRDVSFRMVNIQKEQLPVSPLVEAAAPEPIESTPQETEEEVPAEALAAE